MPLAMKDYNLSAGKRWKSSLHLLVFVGMDLKSRNDPLDKRMSNNIVLVKVSKLDSLNIRKDLPNKDESG